MQYISPACQYVTILVVIAVDSTLCVSGLIEFSLLYKIYAVVLSILELYELKLNFTFIITYTKINVLKFHHS